MIETTHNVIVRSKSGRMKVSRSGFSKSVVVSKYRHGQMVSDMPLTEDEARELFNSLGEMFKELKRWNG